MDPLGVEIDLRRHIGTFKIGKTSNTATFPLCSEEKKDFGKVIIDFTREDNETDDSRPEELFIDETEAQNRDTAANEANSFILVREEAKEGNNLLTNAGWINAHNRLDLDPILCILSSAVSDVKEQVLRKASAGMLASL